MRDFIRNITRLNLPVTILLLAGSVALWIPDFINAVGEEQQTYVLFYLPHIVSVELFPLTILVLTFVVTVISAIVIMSLLYYSGLTQDRSMLPIVIYMLLIGSIRTMHYIFSFQIGMMILCGIFVVLYNIYRNPNSSEEVFLATMLLLVASILIPDLLWFVVFVWIALVVERAVNLRTWLASVIAIAVFAIFIILSETWFGDGLQHTTYSIVFNRQLPEISTTNQLAIKIIFILISIALTVYYFSARQRLNVKIIVACDLFLIAALFTFILLLFPVATEIPALVAQLYPVGALSITALATLYFSDTPTVLRGSLFLTFIFVLIIYWIV